MVKYGPYLYLAMDLYMCWTDVAPPSLSPKVFNVPVPPRQVMGLNQESHSDERLLLSPRSSSCREKSVDYQTAQSV